MTKVNPHQRSYRLGPHRAATASSWKGQGRLWPVSCGAPGLSCWSCFWGGEGADVPVCRDGPRVGVGRVAAPGCVQGSRAGCRAECLRRELGEAGIRHCSVLVSRSCLPRLWESDDLALPGLVSGGSQACASVARPPWDGGPLLIRVVVSDSRTDPVACVCAWLGPHLVGRASYSLSHVS